MKKVLTFALTVVLTLCLGGTAFADLPIKPVDDPWNNPENLIKDGNIYLTYNEAGYVVVWETPACDLDGKYILLNNNSSVLVDDQVKYMDAIPWGSVGVMVTDSETGERKEFRSWILMTDLRFPDGTPAFEIPPEIPEHPMIPDPIPVPTQEPEATPVPTEEPAETPVPQRPEEAITVNTTFNRAIVYTSVAIAAAALALVAFVLIKHKALNKKGE